MPLITSKDAFNDDESEFGFHKGQVVEVTEKGAFEHKQGIIVGFGKKEMHGIIHVEIAGPPGEDHIWPFEPQELEAVE